VDRARHQVGAVVAAVGRAGRALWGDAFAVLTVGEDTGVLRTDRATRVVAGPAVFVVRLEVATEVNRAAIGDVDRAICPLTDPAAALDSDETALADGPAGAAMLHVRLEVDADTAAASQTGSALTRLHTLPVDAVLTGGTGGVTISALLRVGIEVNAFALAARVPSDAGAIADTSNAGERARALTSAATAVVVVHQRVNTNAAAAPQSRQARARLRGRHAGWSRCCRSR